jgi:YggT family protein
METLSRLLSNFLVATADALSLILTVYLFIVIARAVISWVSPDPYNPIVRFLYAATEPLLSRVRRWLFRTGLVMEGLDLSPLLVMAAVYFLQKLLVGSLLILAQALS